MSPPKAERRRFPRIQSENVVLVKKIGGESLKAVARTGDLALGGCRFVYGQPVGEGATIELSIVLQDRFIEAVGKIVYQLPRRDGNYDMGVEFAVIDKDARDALQALVEKQSLKELKSHR